MKQLVLFALSLSMLMACKKDDVTPEDPISENDSSNFDYLVMVTNEGPFGAGSGTVSQINLSSGQANYELFENSNGYPLGNIVQSSHVYNDHAYVLVNNSDKIEVAGYPGFASTATISGLGQPRYMVSHNGKGYVTDWSSGGVHVLNLNSNSLSTTISTGDGPENMVVHNGKLYVANSGGFGTDNKVSVIDLSSQSVTEQIVVSDNPHSMVIDNSGYLRVLCRGAQDWNDPDNDTPGALLSIDTDNNSVVSTMVFSSTGMHPNHLAANATGDQMYFLLNGDIYSLDAESTNLPESPLVSGNFYSLGFHPDAQSLLATDALDYQSNGKMYVFDEGGNEQAVFNTGVIPSHVLPL